MFLESDEFKIYFEEIELLLLDMNIENLFMKKNNKTLKETLDHKRYHFLNRLANIYNIDLNLKLGVFLEKLKRLNNNDYKLFLNKYGDKKYCKFRIKNKDYYLKKGLYIFMLKDEIVYIGRCLDNFKKRINNGYGRISPKNTFIDGQSTNCHINSLINENLSNVKFYVSLMNDENQIKDLEKKLIQNYKPIWNIALK